MSSEDDNEGTAQNANKLTKNIPVATRIEYLKKAKADATIAAKVTTMRSVWETGQLIIDKAIEEGRLDIAHTAYNTQINMLGLLNDPQYVRRHILDDDGSKRGEIDVFDNVYQLELEKRNRDADGRRKAN